MEMNSRIGSAKPETEEEASGEVRALSLLQPVYLPWLGYFEQMALVDHFVFFDDAQYTRQDWRNRNRVLSKNGPIWLIVPVKKCKLGTPIREVLVDNGPKWRVKHLKSIEQNYRGATYFSDYFGELEEILTKPFERLVDLDLALIAWISRKLGIATETSLSSDLDVATGLSEDLESERNRARNMRIIRICQRHGATVFYEGARGADFIDLELFRQNGIEVVFQNYRHPEYPQCRPGFESHMSAIDLLMNTGPDARRILLSSPVPEPLSGRTRV